MNSESVSGKILMMIREEVEETMYSPRPAPSSLSSICTSSVEQRSR